MTSLPSTCWLVSYDVRNDARRTTLARDLEHVGRRVLLSGFVLPPFDDADVLAVSRLLWADLDPASDSLVAVPWCPQCRLHLNGLRIVAGDEPVIT